MCVGINFWTAVLRGRLSGEFSYILLAICFAGLTCQASAAPVAINLGVFTFDVLIPGTAQSPGLDQFTINNFTGLNNLVPDFPIADSVTFQNISVNFGSGAIAISDVGPGSVQPSALTFLDTNQFTSATFQATLSGSQFLLADGTTLILSSNVVSGVILPSQGSDLNAGVDFALLTVNGTIVSIPEPFSWGLALAAFVFLFGSMSVSLVRAFKKYGRS